MDLILRHANLPDGRHDVDVAIDGGRIVAIEAQLAAAAREEIDCAHRLVSPAFVDSHFHLDAA
ncbi:MAG TPA: cytosine deaminase, partial [Candidatus Saccharimonadia bacterium]|nr:cytosine deaminase [Candidatus Saccharimonadia bacterium]